MIKRILRKIFPSPNSFSYHIGFIEKQYIIKEKGSWYKRVKWIKSSKFAKDGWFADPFFYDIREDYIFLLAEQWYNPINRGRLVKLKIRRHDYYLEEVIPVLILENHLSYPIIWREDNNTYVYPENYEGGALKIWEFDGEKLFNPNILIEEPLLDSQIAKLGSDYFIFGVKYKTGNLEDTRILDIWKSSNLMGPYCHIQTVLNEHNYFRGAGQIKVVNETTLLRPAQNCEGTYGKETIIYELRYNGTEFETKELYRITPNKKCKYGNVLHTYNECQDLCVIDGLCYKHRIVKKIANIINMSR